MPWFYILPFTFYILSFIGCATAPYIAPTVTPAVPGIYHRVEKGETLWQISKIYDVSLRELARVNHISDATNIEIGQLIFIPHRRKVEPPLRGSYGEDFIWPVRGKVIATFGHAYNDMLNKGINIATSGDASIVAARSGRVVFYSPALKGFGRTIIIDHGDGFSTVYAGISEAQVKADDRVEKGGAIAKMGAAMQNSCLHFEIRKGYTPENPYFYLP